MSFEIKLEEDGKTVHVEGEIVDQELFDVLQEQDEELRTETFLGIVKIGAAGFKRMNVGVDLDYVEKKLDNMMSNLEQHLDPKVETSHLGVFMARVKEYFDKGGRIEDILDPETEHTPLGKFVKSLGEYFDSGGTLEKMLNPDNEDSPLGRFSKRLDEYLGKGGRLEELLDPGGDGTPIAKLKKEILDEIKQLRDIVGKEEAWKEAVDITTLKGYEFEDACEEILGECSEFGCPVTRTTDEVGKIPRCKKGDFVVETDNGSSIVFEVKDWQNVSLNKIRDEMKEAMNNRGADYGVFVSKYIEALPKDIGWFNEYGNTLVCTLGSREADTLHPEMLHIAYQWARLRQKSNGEVDTEAVNKAIKELDELKDMLEELAKINKKCTTASNAIKDIEKVADSLEESLENQIGSVKRALGAIVP